jgi:predicted metalloprotease
MLVLSWIRRNPDVDPGAMIRRADGRGRARDVPRRMRARLTQSWDTEDTWADLRAQPIHSQPTLVFSPARSIRPGFNSAASGPFYCPRDRKVYIDLSFYRDLARRFGAPGDFAQAYVLAHEVGHHVQNLTGALGSRDDSVATELQADCLAGVWGYSAARRNMLETGDVEEGLAAAAAIGDDRLQQQSQGRVVPESFTHGSSAQRVAAFRRGLENGDPAACGMGR